MGDWNAKVGEEDGGSRNVGRFGLRTKNERGANLVEFAQAHNLKIANTFFKKKGKRKWTWVSPDSNTRNEINHILVNDISIITDVTTLSKFSFPSDHRITRGRISIPKRVKYKNYCKIKPEEKWMVPVSRRQNANTQLRCIHISE